MQLMHLAACCDPLPFLRHLWLSDEMQGLELCRMTSLTTQLYVLADEQDQLLSALEK